MILDPQVVRLTAWFATLQADVGEVITDRLQNSCISQLGLVSQTLQEAASTADRGPALPGLLSELHTPSSGSDSSLLAAPAPPSAGFGLISQEHIRSLPRPDEFPDLGGAARPARSPPRPDLFPDLGATADAGPARSPPRPDLFPDLGTPADDEPAPGVPPDDELPTLRAPLDEHANIGPPPDFAGSSPHARVSTRELPLLNLNSPAPPRPSSLGPQPRASSLDTNTLGPPVSTLLRLRPETRSWKLALEQDIRPALHRARGTLRAAAAAFSDHSALAALRAELAATLARQPQNISFDVAPEDSSVSPTKAPTRVEVPLRRWLTETLQPGLEALFAELDARVAAAVDDATAELERIETVLDYHLFIVEDARAPEERHESARTGLGHGVRLVQQLADKLALATDRVHRWFLAATSAAMDDAIAPLRAHRPEEVVQSLAVLEASKTPSWWQTRVRAVRGGLGDAYKATAPIVRELAGDLRGLLRGDQPRVGYWDLVIASDISDERLPALYRRLFGEIPLGMSDLYRPRPALETPCRKVFEAWLSGQTKSGDRRSSLLVVGDRGAGKRTLVNRVRAELHGGLPVRWLSLGPHLASEPRLCTAIADAADVERQDDFVGLAGSLRQVAGRQAIVIENGEQIFLRTPEGLARVQAFLDLIRATDDRILWIVLMVGPTATLLDTCLRLSLYFSQVVRLPPASGAFLEDMLRARHRVSGLGLRFRARRAPVVERLRRPFARADVLLEPAAEWFADLERIAAGNLQQALTYWQLATRVDHAGTEVVVRPLPRARGRALTQLSLPQRLVLATLVQHGALTEEQIMETLPLHGHGAAPEIDDLRRRRLIEPCPEEPDYLQLRPVAALPVTLDLRWRNML